MKFTIILLTFGTTTGVLAADLVDFWTDANFLGLKHTGQGNVGECKNLPGDFNDRISSAKARSGYRCTVWIDANCNTGTTGYSFDTSSGSSFPGWINDKASSWKCVRA
ncbi:hypothetical protein SMACR_07708 [Sordaria macrospora]|uniref:WGS project CABT00000000 data, contig 2.27 n=2 Tax=Sordaria macrospora TaxID=5147 RepID=F7W4E1_SORMK|nr:uncharacterized protein SMAC_07708 [Sordaria macrospora k-hell]KAA8634896.1 hypothetical protein SMACR_07708 [Sordaria macrospora]KAH7635461.1 hypothetical protein B0T09DRAFT_379255 [Sordaria sp. MPI-SDFR-AT-0083]WPJ67393.1 hypothetical protein SMAC4_07708 [Sordaria macrospora]CCC14894.1 unnamed protein product [Sordaria macrospora k-hell]